jgi:pseudaminic acid synthase
VTDGPRIEIAGRAVGAGCPVYVIAELSANHGGDLERARAIVRAAAEAGCDAVKLQTYTADTLTLDCDAPPFRIEGGTLWDGRTLHELYLEAATPWEWQPELFALAASLGLHAFSSPFDATAIEFLEDLDVPAMKIASFELVDLPLIRRAAASGKPVILSTGMASEEEIREAVDTARAAGAGGVAILRTNSAYPAPPEEMHLRTIPWLTKTFDAPAGLSDHTLGIAVPVAAVALGASIVEKHVCLSRDVPGPDTAFSLEPAELGEMVAAIRTAEAALGEPSLEVTPKQEASRRFRRSLFVVADVRRGEPFTAENVRSIRPADGLPPRELEDVLGRKAARDLARGTPLKREHLA